MALPWKENIPDLPDNNYYYDMALCRLCNTEKHLLKNQYYLEKGFIRKINPTDEKPARRWYLPHFPIVKLDKASTKTRIIIDASAKFGGNLP